MDCFHTHTQTRALVSVMCAALSVWLQLNASDSAMVSALDLDHRRNGVWACARVRAQCLLLKMVCVALARITNQSQMEFHPIDTRTIIIIVKKEILLLVKNRIIQRRMRSSIGRLCGEYDHRAAIRCIVGQDALIDSSMAQRRDGWHPDNKIQFCWNKYGFKMKWQVTFERIHFLPTMPRRSMECSTHAARRFLDFCAARI